MPHILGSVLGQTRPPDQVLLIDNGSTDATRCVGHRFGVEVVSLAENVGFASAMNEGIRRADSDWIMMVNNDVQLHRDWLSQLLEACEETGAAFASGKLLQANCEETIDGTWDLVSRAAFAWRCGYGRPDGEIWSRRRVISSAPMTAAIFRRDIFAQIGLLETRFGSYYEDVDFGVRCSVAGFEGIYEPTAIAEHIGKATLGASGGRVEFMTARNQLLLLAKHYSTDTLRHFAWPILVGQILALMAAAKHGFFFDTLLGKWDGLRKWSEFRRSATQSARSAAQSPVEDIFLQSESEIRRLQQEIGPDLYWRMYFRLVPCREKLCEALLLPMSERTVPEIETAKVD